MFGWFQKPKTLSEVLFAGYRVKVHGIIFKVRKLNPLDFASGAKALQMHFQTYQTATQKQQLEMVVSNQNKIKEHYTDVIMASVIEPKLSRKKDEEGAIWVENLFTDWDLANELYMAIVNLTNGKKKLKPST